MKRPDMNLAGHASMLGACVIWGLMAPVAKSAMEHGLNSFTLISLRVVGAAFCFWATSFFTRREKVADHDLFLFFFAALSAIVFSQCQFTIGLGYTSPVDASIITTMVPIFTLVLAAVFLREPVTGKKVLGIFCGAIGALLLITGSRTSGTGGHASGVFGDTLVLIAQLSFAIYLTLFKHLISRYSVVTCMKWMFTYASIAVIPFTYRQFSELNAAALPPVVWAEAAYVVIGGTFVAYILMVCGQKRLRPTIVSMYNYTQPVVACAVSVAAGMGVFGWMQALAVVLVFGGVYLVTQSKSRADELREQEERKAAGPRQP